MSSMSLVPYAALCGHAYGLRANTARRLCQGLLFAALFFVVFAPEFPRVASAYGSSIVYAKVFGRLRLVDLALLGLSAGHVLCFACMRRRPIRFPRPLAIPGAIFLACIVVAVVYGYSRGGDNFFFDWRGLALGIGLYYVWSFWLQDEADVSFAVRVFAACVALELVLLYVPYLFGPADTLLGVSIPVFDGPVLSSIVFAALLALSCQAAAGSARRLAWMLFAFASTLMLLLCLRRTYWAELAIGCTVLLFLRRRSIASVGAALGAGLLLSTVLLGTSLSARLQSMEPWEQDGDFSADNADHLSDLADAWQQVRQVPLMGIGLGTSYPTWEIRNWKPESVMVHNAPLHVWLKYGLAGLASYLWFHVALLRWVCRLARKPGPRQAFLASAFAYLLAQFVVTLGFAPWPYSEVQMTTVLSFLVAAVACVSRHQSAEPA